MQTEGKEEKRLQGESEGSREKSGSSTGKDQKGQMNDGKMMCKMRGKKTRWEQEEPLKSETLTTFLSPNRLIFIE